MGGTSLAPIQKFHTRYVYSSHIPFAKQESEASKILLNQWTTRANAFKKVTKHMSYAQVLSKNLMVSPNSTVHQDFRHKHKPYSPTSNMNMFKSENENKATSIHRGVIKNQSKPQCIGNKSAVGVTDMACVKASGGSVTRMNNQPHKVTNVNTSPPKNRFQPLQCSPVTALTEELSNYHNDTQLTGAVSNSNATALKVKFQNRQSNGKQFRSVSDSSYKPKSAAQVKFITLEGNKDETGLFTEG